MCKPTIKNDSQSRGPLSPQDLAECPLHLLDLDELEMKLNTSHKISNARMLALGVQPKSSSYSDLDGDSIPIIDAGLAAPLVRILAQAIDQWTDFLSTLTCATQDLNNQPSSPQRKHLSALRLILSSDEMTTLRRVLLLHLNISKADSTLAEEMVRGCGSHHHLSKLISIDVYSILDIHSQDCNDISPNERELYEQVEDSLVEIQDLACELAYNTSIPYPAKVSPFTLEELHARLPLTFDICSPKGEREYFMVGQVTDRQSAQDDVGFVMWPSAVVLASWLLDNTSLFIGQRMDENGDICSTYTKRILEIGSGCGLTGLVAARIVENHRKSIAAKKESEQTVETEDSCEFDSAGQSTPVILSDFNRKVLMNIESNIQLNGLGEVARAFHLDFYLQDGDLHDGGWKGSELKEILHPTLCHNDAEWKNQTAMNQPPVDLILAADTICKPSDAIAVSNTIHDALIPGGEAIVVSANAKHRFGVDIFEDECKRVGLHVVTTDVAEMCDGKLLPASNVSEDEDPCGIRQTSGFVDGMTLTMFRVTKPKIDVCQ
jgi:predicted nicotinamide N-methyase